ncbi:MAG: hypothetical protein QF733_07335 [Phycisphaerales bacterium]|nr:hypothetical protein [Phycisphaerales bacterium]
MTQRDQASLDQPWIAALRRRIAGEAARWGRRDGSGNPTAAQKRTVRTMLIDVLDWCAKTEDACGLVVVACWARSLDRIDAWIDAAGPDEASSVLAAVMATPPQDRLQASAGLAERAALHGPGPRARIASELVRSLQAAGAPRAVERAITAAFDAMIGSEASPESIGSVMSAVQSAINAMEVPEWTTPVQARGAVRVLNDRLVEALIRLESQSGWLLDCEDPMLHPGMRAAMENLHGAASARRNFAAAAGAAFQDAAARARFVDAARQIERGEDGAALHRRVAELARSLGPPSQLPEALALIAWPQDPAERLTWRLPANIDRVSAGRLLALMECRHHLASSRSTRRWRRVCDEIEALAAAMVRGSP